MKSIVKHLVGAAVLAVFGSAAIAQEATSDAWMSAPATKSRAQVQSEMDAAKKDGTIKAVSLTYDFVGRMGPSKSRDQVRAELAEARASGELDAINAEAYAFKPTAPTPVYAKRGSSAAQ